MTFLSNMLAFQQGTNQTTFYVEPGGKTPMNNNEVKNPGGINLGLAFSCNIWRKSQAKRHKTQDGIVQILCPPPDNLIIQELEETHEVRIKKVLNQTPVSQTWQKVVRVSRKNLRVDLFHCGEVSEAAPFEHYFHSEDQWPSYVNLKESIWFTPYLKMIMKKKRALANDSAIRRSNTINLTIL